VLVHGIVNKDGVRAGGATAMDAILGLDTQQPKVDSRLGGAISEARLRASSLGRPVLFRVHASATNARPDTLLEAADTAGVGWFYWHDPVAGQTVVAVDSAGAPEAEDERIARSGGCFESREQVMDVPLVTGETVDPDQPLRVGGFAFGSGLPTDGGPWTGWPWRHLPAPTIQLTRVAGGEGATLVVSAGVTARSTPSGTLRRIRRALGLVLAAGRRPDVVGVQHRDLCCDHTASVDACEYQSWDTRVCDALKAIENGELRKVVLARSERINAPDGHVFDPLATLEVLKDRHPTSFTFGVGRPDGRCFVGASPELLVRIKDGVLETVAMAGTASRAASPDDDDRLARGLLESAKEREEHAFVVDAISAALAPLCEDLEVPNSPTIRRLTHVQHLATPIRGRIREGVTIVDVAAALHPTPAVGGVPRDAALRWLRDNEGLERGWYAAPLGWVGSDGDGVLAVGIRSAMLDGAEAHAFAGAGLVAGSTPEAEWAETSLKLQTVAGALRSRRIR
jgi:isochorismate synthase